MTKEKLVLAYSGGLDTSVILHWLVHHKVYDVVAYTADVGQPKLDYDAVKQKALNTGASYAVVEDLRGEFVTDYIFPAVVRGNARYEDRYLLGTYLARPLTAKGQIKFA